MIKSTINTFKEWLGFKPIAGSDGKMPKKGGIVVGYEKLADHKEKLYVLDGDIHSLILGGTGSGKTRCLLLQSMGLLGLAEESMIVSDPKGELFEYTAPYLKALGYNVCALNFKIPTKSQSYNFLQSIIDTVNTGNLAKAVDQYGI